MCSHLLCAGVSHTRAHLRMNWVGRQIDVSSLGTITVSKSTSIRTCRTSSSFLMNSWSSFLWSTSIFIHSLYDYIYVLVLTDIYTRVHVWITVNRTRTLVVYLRGVFGHQKRLLNTLLSGLPCTLFQTCCLYEH